MVKIRERSCHPVPSPVPPRTTPETGYTRYLEEGDSRGSRRTWNWAAQVSPILLPLGQMAGAGAP